MSWLTPLKKWKGQLFLGVVILTVFYPTFQAEFLSFDDDVYVWQNPYIREGVTFEGLKWAFTADLTTPSLHTDYWQPMTILSRMLDIHFFGLNAKAHHAINLIWHWMNVCLVFVISRRIFKNTLLGLCLALCFALHPLQVEVVAWITARKDLVAVFFGLVSMHYFLTYLKSKKRGDWAQSFVFFICALMAKPVMITLPFLLTGLTIFLQDMEKRSLKQNLVHACKLCWPFFLISIIYLPIPFIGQPLALEKPVNTLWARGLYHYGFYLKMFMCPFGLNLYGPIPEMLIEPAWIILSATVVFLLTGIFIWKSFKMPLFGFGWFWFLVTLLPAVILTWPANRFMYWPILGLFISFFAFLQYFSNQKTRWPIRIGLGSLFVFYGILSFKQSGYWKNNETLFTRALKYSPKNYVAHDALGNHYAQRDDVQKAIRHYKASISIRPHDNEVYNNYGILLEKIDKFQLAERMYQKAILDKPENYQSYNNLGILYVRQNQFKKAIGFFLKASALAEKNEVVHRNLVLAYLADGQINKAYAYVKTHSSPMLESILAQYEDGLNGNTPDQK